MTATQPLRATYTRGPEVNGSADPPAPSAMLAARSLAPHPEELGAVIDRFMQAAEKGEADDGYGQHYTSDGLRELHSSLSHVKSELGTMHVQAIRRWHVQGMLDELRRAGLAPGRLTAVVEALHALYSHAIERGLVDDSPVIWLTFPQQAVRPERVRAAPVQRPAPVSELDPLTGTTPTPTHAMLVLGGRVLLWTVRATVTLFVLVAIVLVVEFA
jgi:hypothetical protein